jgi:hypothetical protein
VDGETTQVVMVRVVKEAVIVWSIGVTGGCGIEKIWKV